MTSGYTHCVCHWLLSAVTSSSEHIGQSVLEVPSRRRNVNSRPGERRLDKRVCNYVVVGRAPSGQEGAELPGMQRLIGKALQVMGVLTGRMASSGHSNLSSGAGLPSYAERSAKRCGFYATSRTNYTMMSHHLQISSVHSVSRIHRKL